MLARRRSSKWDEIAERGSVKYNKKYSNADEDVGEEAEEEKVSENDGDRGERTFIMRGTLFRLSLSLESIYSSELSSSKEQQRRHSHKES